MNIIALEGTAHTFGCAVINEKGEVITSSPSLSLRLPNWGDFKVEIANKLAEEPELVRKQCLTPINLANLLANFLVNLPSVHQPSNTASTPAISSFASKTLPEEGIISLPGTTTREANFFW